MLELIGVIIGVVAIWRAIRLENIAEKLDKTLRQTLATQQVQEVWQRVYTACLNLIAAAQRLNFAHYDSAFATDQRQQAVNFAAKEYSVALTCLQQTSTMVVTLDGFHREIGAICQKLSEGEVDTNVALESMFYLLKNISSRLTVLDVRPFQTHK